MRAFGTGSALLACAFLLACRPEPQQSAPSPAPEPDAPAAVVPPPQPPAPPQLDRAALLAAVAAAADSFAAGAPYPNTVAALQQRRFVLRLPFGCGGPGLDSGGLSYTLDDKGVLRLSARPQVWTQAAWALDLVRDTPVQSPGTAAPSPAPTPTPAAPPAPQVEALEGFWIDRPWLVGEVCPTLPPPPPEAAGASRTVALAQVFGPDDSRLLRRGGRPYEATEAIAPEQPAPTRGFRLRLEGRIAEAAGRPIRCRAEHSELHPLCLVQVRLDRLVFEDADGRAIAEFAG